MNAHAKRLYRTISTTTKHVAKTLFLSGVIFITLATSAGAQSASFTEYLQLFDSKPGESLQKGLVMQIAKTKDLPNIGGASNSSTPAQTLDYFKFNFRGTFNPSRSGVPNNYKDWYWGHIAPFSQRNNTFILRICNTDGYGSADETNCVFSPVPYAYNPGDNDTRIDGTTYCNNGRCVVPSEDEATTKIYYWRSQVGTCQGVAGDCLKESSTRYAKFNVQINASSFSTIQNGGLSAPINTFEKFKIGDPTQYKADIWYCAQDTNNQSITQANETDPNIRFFENLCGGGRPYVRIAQSNPFKMPATNAEAVNQTETQVTAGSTADDQGVFPNCHILDGAGPGEGSFVGCIAWVVYYGIYQPVQWFAALMGNLFDFFIGYSLSDESYRADFAVRGWQLVRDISNIFFIVILVYVGIATVFNMSSANMKKVVANLILNALLINFSLFVTRVVIDVSNVVARVFYHSVEVCQGKCVDENNDGSPDNLLNGPGGFPSLSAKIVSSFNPQKIFSAQALDSQKVGGNKTATTDNVTSNDQDKTDKLNRNDYATTFVIISLIAAMILFAVAMMFWKTAFFFLGRVIGLYIAMIFSPFAFLGRGGIPLVGGIEKISWKNWWKDLSNYAMLAPIFVFFLYIIYAFIDSDFITGFTKVNSGNSFLETVVYIAIPMLIVYFMISKGVDIAKTYAGELGKQVQGFAQKATGIVAGGALGVATGGAAFLGRNAVGRGLRLIGNSGKKAGLDGKITTRAERWAANANNSWFARQGNNLYAKTQTGSWDARNTKLGGLTQKAGGLLGGQMGVKFSDNVSGSIYGLGKDSGKGGVIEVNKKLAKKKQELFEKKIDMSHLSDDEAKNAAAKYKSDQIKKYGEAHWEDHIEEVDALKTPKAAMDAAKEALDTAIKDLDAKTKAGTATTPDRLAVNRAQKDFDDKKQAFDLAKTTIINNVKQGKADTLKDKASEFAQKKKEEELAAYKIKDAASFGNMMRAEYVNGLQNASFMKKLLEGIDLTNPTSMIGATAGIAIATLIPPLAPVVVAAMTTAIAKELTDEAVYAATGSNGKAVKAINKKAKSKAGTGNVLIDMEARLESLKAVVTNAIKKDFDKVTEDEILDYTADLQGKVDDLNDKIKTKSGTPDELKQARRDRARALDELDKLKNIQDKIARQQKDIDDHKQKEKEKEENKKEKKEKEK